MVLGFGLLWGSSRFRIVLCYVSFIIVGLVFGMVGLGMVGLGMSDVGTLLIGLGMSY